MEPIVEMRQITKRFGINTANDAVDFRCYPGEILCLLGENGAGKTTLMKVLYGMYRPDEGEIRYRGEPVRITSPRKAISLQIQMVHQHFMLVPTLSVADNVVLGKEPRRRGLYDRSAGERLVRELSEQYGLKVTPGKLAGELSVGEQQRTEIIKALYQGAQILILDEPTAVLTPQEVEELFLVMRRLREEGKTVIIITHKLKETMAVSDRVCVLRQGRLIGERRTAQTDIDELSELMVGHKVQSEAPEPLEAGAAVLEMDRVRLRDKNGSETLRGVSLTVREHEILGVAGVEGNGQMELIDVLSALQTGWEGEILHRGSSIRGKQTGKLIGEGFSFIHADRQRSSVVLSLPVPENFLLGEQNGGEYRKGRIVVDWEKVRTRARELMERYDVRPADLHLLLEDFSGGNQQKFVVGRELSRNPDFLIAAHPTRGVDIMATDFIHGQLIAQRRRGAGVLLVSSDLDELLRLSDRIAVIYDGEIVACRPTGEFTTLELGRLMGGGGAVE